VDTIIFYTLDNTRPNPSQKYAIVTSKAVTHRYREPFTLGVGKVSTEYTTLS